MSGAQNLDGEPPVYNVTHNPFVVACSVHRCREFPICLGTNIDLLLLIQVVLRTLLSDVTSGERAITLDIVSYITSTDRTLSEFFLNSKCNSNCITSISILISSHSTPFP